MPTYRYVCIYIHETSYLQSKCLNMYRYKQKLPYSYRVIYIVMNVARCSCLCMYMYQRGILTTEWSILCWFMFCTRSMHKRMHLSCIHIYIHTSVHEDHVTAFGFRIYICVYISAYTYIYTKNIRNTRLLVCVYITL